MKSKFVGKNIKFLRVKNKLSQEQLAKQLGINRGNIASYESMKAEPSAGRLAKIAKLFNIDLIKLIETDLSKETTSITSERIEELGVEDGETIEEKLEHLLEQNTSDLERYIKRFSEMQKIVDGFKEFHKFKMSSYKEVSSDLKSMASDYERLLELMENILKTNEEMVSYVKSKDKR